MVQPEKVCVRHGKLLVGWIRRLIEGPADAFWFIFDHLAVCEVQLDTHREFLERFRSSGFQVVDASSAPSAADFFSNNQTVEGSLLILR